MNYQKKLIFYAIGKWQTLSRSKQKHVTKPQITNNVTACKFLLTSWLNGNELSY